MYALLNALSLRDLLLQQAPIAMSSLIIAELFYKFHSFTLEAAAFLGTWFVIDAVTGAVLRFLRR